MSLSPKRKQELEDAAVILCAMHSLPEERRGDALVLALSIYIDPRYVRLTPEARGEVAADEETD